MRIQNRAGMELNEKLEDRDEDLDEGEEKEEELVELLRRREWESLDWLGSSASLGSRSSLFWSSLEAMPVFESDDSSKWRLKLKQN